MFLPTIFRTVSRAAGHRLPTPWPRLCPSSPLSCYCHRTRSSGAPRAFGYPNIAAPYPTRRHTATFSTTMPSRGRKRASASANPPTGEPLQHNPTSAPPTQEKSSGPRRSSRRTAASKKATTKDSGAGMEPNLGTLEDARAKGLSPKNGAEEVEKQAENAGKSVGSAMQGLEEMEMSFKRDIKRRKLQVEQSFVQTSADDTGRGLKRCVTFDEHNVVRLDRILPTPERDDTCEHEDDAWEPALDDGDEANDESPEAADRGAKRAPAVNSDYLPLPWKGRLGYACLNTYLRAAKPPVFSSRTCRIASILEHRFPLTDPTQVEHPTKNRPDKTKKPDVGLGQKYVESLGLANARDTVKMLQWNDKYGIKFMRLSSEMFPFAGHEEYGYKLAPFASEALAQLGKIAAELGHRLTTHPGQFTQLGSPRKVVVDNAKRDLEYHDEMLSLLKLPPQQNRDAVMILHMGGTFNDAGGKPATLDRFRQNYATLSESIKRRLVLENDDVSWSVHDLLPVCEELNIPLVLDYHHHNIVFDADKCREGSFDISQPEISDRITRTWTRKGIKQKMHYSEPCPGAITPRERRKHSPRVGTLPPCPPDMDLMIEAKDKEQAVFELMRRFKLPGHERMADLVAHEREDQDRPPAKKPKAKKASSRKRKSGANKEALDDAANEDGDTGESALNPDEDPSGAGLQVSAEDFGMGGPLNRVYWPVGYESWLTPKKKERKVKVKDTDD